ncbi:DUF6701 domain-containing protein [uncultured Massilia sp.]|uniref:DUF6701 domain-containing protein n=1 Tax=uncultured Massilia sp. TaxID=169973 RepID=UPI00258B88DB|nr:DUF6701 domain-containing protein [uncultured Massilia sp.]
MLNLARALTKRRGPSAWMAACLLALAGMLGSGAAQATTYTFNGNAVDSCTLSNKVYTCPYPAYLEWNDAVVIGSGYTLKVTNNVAVGWNQGLSMGSGARLIVTGDLDLNAINPANLKISGGDIEVGGTFSMGASQHTATANISAGAIQLGTDRVTITGNLTSRGVVNISSSSRITGDVRGTVVTAGSPVTITGDVSASSKFSLGSGSTVSGDVTAPVFDMLASGSRVTGTIVATTSMTMGSGNTVTGSITTGTFSMEASGSKVTGNVTATKSMTMGSGNAVTGNVDTGDLLLQSSSAIITGDARVNWATLEWAGRVTGTIYCKNGTGKNKCDCVTNNSGYQVNSTNGPRCEGLAPATPHHFLITHDGEGDTCLEEKITVTACANAACTAPHFAGAVTGGKLKPFDAAFSIPANAGSQTVNVTRFAAGAVTLALEGLSAQAATTCYRTGNNSGSCAMTFAGGIKLRVDVPDHAAGAGGILATIQGVKANASQTACVAAFENKTYDVSYSCNYSKPKTGSEKLTLGGKALSCGAATASAATTSIRTEFKTAGIATLALSYPDAGEVRLNASAAIPDDVTATGAGNFITVPAKFTLAPAAGPLRAGAAFSVGVTAVNTAGVKTPNFDTAALDAAGAIAPKVTLDIACRAQNGVTDDAFASDLLAFKGGVATPNARWSEVGRIDLAASLDGFMGNDALKAAGSTNTATAGKCSGSVGAFIPQYFQVAIERPGTETERTWHYSREPFVMKVTAMNAAGIATRNFDAGVRNQTTNAAYTEDVNLSVVDENGAALAAAPGALNVAGVALTKIQAAQFVKGSVTLLPNYAFTNLKTAPLTIRLRGANGKVAPADVTSAFSASPDPDAGKEAKTNVRSGRLRLVNRFGSARGELKMPVLAEVWRGSSWVQHTDDVYTAIPLDAFVVVPKRQSNAAASGAPFKVNKSNKEPNLKLVGGIGALGLMPSGGGPGWGDVAANLGDTAADSACMEPLVKPVSTGAKLPWLRSLNVCSKDNKPDTDPWARATFGVFEPETKRIIHVREVFR